GPALLLFKGPEAPGRAESTHRPRGPEAPRPRGPEAWGRRESRRPAGRGAALRPPPSALRPPPSALRPPPSALRPPPPVRGGRRYRPLMGADATARSRGGPPLPPARVGAGNRHRRAFLAGFCPVLGR